MFSFRRSCFPPPVNTFIHRHFIHLYKTCFGVCFLFVRVINVSLWKNTATKFKLNVISTKEMLLENLEVLIQTG
ncbi:hypothetical protein R3I94_020671 [Phoxinus phoxinus]